MKKIFVWFGLNWGGGCVAIVAATLASAELESATAPVWLAVRGATLAPDGVTSTSAYR